MRTEDLESLKTAKTVVDEIIASRFFGIQPAAEMSSTDFNQLSPEAQQLELQIAEDDDQGNRARAALHMCLIASSVSIEVAQKLMALPGLPREERAALILRCGEDALAACDAASHAAAVLTKQEPPETDAFFEISKFS